MLHTCDSGGKVPLYHSMHPCNKEISKYEAHITDDFKAYIDKTLNDLLGAVVNNATIELINDENDKIILSHQSHSNDNSNQRFKSMCPSHVKRKNDKRLKSYWEI